MENPARFRSPFLQKPISELFKGFGKPLINCGFIHILLAAFRNSCVTIATAFENGDSPRKSQQRKADNKFTEI
jgi:hypothetical protein